jgi:hypothetical protein
VCSFNPPCCDTAWDSFCVQLAEEECGGLCGADASGDCFSPHANPGCDNAVCCEIVCLFDTFCCSESWDTNCATIASLQCAGVPAECGDPSSGSCFESHPESACEDLGCCESVCTFDQSCCESAWDYLCVGIAESICNVACEVECPSGAVPEGEVCGVFQNDPCVFQDPGAAPKPLASGQTVCGRIVDENVPHPDVDVYSIAAIDSDGDGEVHLEITFTAMFDGFAAIVPAASCSLQSAVLVATSTKCIPGNEELCVPPGAYRIIVTSGDYPAPGGGEATCSVDDLYTLTLVCTQACTPICEVAEGDCFAPHPTPGCETQGCCELVCDPLPGCCEIQWDLGCAQTAFDLCGGEPPANDSCQDATVIAEGTIPFSTLGATSKGPDLPESCNEGFGLSFESDIWYSYTPSCNAVVTVETCDQANFDTRLAIYLGTCDGLVLVACNDDSDDCFSLGTSRIEFEPFCTGQYRFASAGSAPPWGRES